MEIFKIIDQLEYELSDKRGLFGKKIDIDKCWNLVIELKNMLPAYLSEAQQIVNNKEQLLKNADIIAKNVISEAESRIANMMDRSEITSKAEIEGQRIISHAHKKSEDIVSTTKLHLDDVFFQTEKYIQAIAENIKTSRAELKQSLENNI
jgi:hypothetical protein